MSRSHPDKPKPRSARHTAQIVVEGFTEEAFCKHLKRLYARDCGVRVEIHNARGKCPQHVIESALVRRGFDRTFVVFDADRDLPAAWRRKSLAAGHVHVIPNPCFDALLLQLLAMPCPRDSKSCKRAFDAVLPPPNKYTPDGYAKRFLKELLDQSNHPMLLDLLSAFREP